MSKMENKKKEENDLLADVVNKMAYSIRKDRKEFIKKMVDYMKKGMELLKEARIKGIDYEEALERAKEEYKM